MTNQFLGSNHAIGLDEARKMTKKFKEEKDRIMREEFKGKHIIPNCESFDRELFDILLRREDCKGLRIYYGMKGDSNRIHAIIVGFDADGKDILPLKDVAMDGIEPPIIENSLPCPDHCPPPSDLNIP